MKNGLVWLIGKPGSGKTTVGEHLASMYNNIAYYSFSSLLKEFQSEVGEEGFRQDTRDKVYRVLTELSSRKLVMVSGNPYTATSFLDMKKLSDTFKVVHFFAPDHIVLERLVARNREVFFHDGTSQKERLEKFNKEVQPRIEQIIDECGVTVFVEGKTKEDIAKEIMTYFSDASIGT